MLTRLPESNARRQRRPGGFVVSTAVHLVIIALAVRASGLTAAPRPKAEPIDRPIFIARTVRPVSPPPTRPLSSNTSMPTVPPETPISVVVDTDIPTTIPAPGSMNGLIEFAFKPTSVSATGLPSESPNVADGSPLPENLVEKTVIAIPGTGTPRYPSMLQTAGVEGDVRAQFVVDTLGRVEQGSFKALESTHDLFAAAVRDALGTARFKSAEVGGHRVRQLVEQTFTFRITK